MVQLNVAAVHELTLAFLRPMVERRAGAILNVASLAAFQPVPGMATYAATKAFVQSFSEALHAELAGTGVSCTVLAPGAGSDRVRRGRGDRGGRVARARVRERGARGGRGGGGARHAPRPALGRAGDRDEGARDRRPLRPALGRSCRSPAARGRGGDKG